MPTGCHAVTGAEVPHVFAHLLDHAKGLMTEDGAGAHARHGAADQVQVGAAERRCPSLQ